MRGGNGTDADGRIYFYIIAWVYIVRVFRERERESLSSSVREVSYSSTLHSEISGTAIFLQQDSLSLQLSEKL